MSTLKLSFVISAVDKATDKVRHVNQAIDKMTEPVRKVRASFSSLIKESRFDRVAASVGRLRDRMGDLMDWGRSAVGVLAAVGVAAGGVVYSMKRIADQVDAVSDVAKTLNVTTEALSKMGYAAQLNGSSQQEMNDALLYLSNRITEAVNGSKEAVEWFGRLGIPLKRLKGLRATDALEVIADKFKEVGDEGGNAEKKIAAMRVMLGRSSLGMKQMLDLGSDGMRQFYKEAERLGAVISTDTAEAMGDFNDGVDRMKFSLFGVMSVITKSALPVLNDLVKRTTEWAVANRETIGTKIGAFVEKLVVKLPPFIDAVTQVATALAMVLGVLNTVAQALGGWDTVIVAISATIAGKLVWALGLAAQALFGVGTAFAMTPFGWFMAAVAALAAAVYLIYKHWGPIKDWFAGLWDGIKSSFSASIDWIVEKVMSVVNWVSDKIVALNNLMPDWVKKYTPGGMVLNAAAQAVAPAAPVASTIAGGRQNVSVGGTLKIEIDAEGRPRVAQLKSDAPGFELDVYHGTTMVGP